MAFIADTFHLDQSGQKVEKLKLADVGVKPMSGGGGGNVNPVANSLNHAQRTLAMTAATSLFKAFPWDATKEGVVFWKSVYDRLQDVARGGLL